jgi:hypothetical protein
MTQDNEIDRLILSGAIEAAGVDPDTGELLYVFTDKLKDINPLLHAEVNNLFSSHIMKLWELGIVNMDVTSRNPLVTLSPKAFDEKVIESLDKETYTTLKEIKRNLT